MPLPAALAARLAKRGIITNSDKPETARKEPKKKVHEEVIAEDYDSTKDDLSQIDLSQQFMGHPGCPNKYNIYHECSRKCKEIWGAGHLQPTEDYLKKQMRMLQKYPLPETWKAVYDPGTGQHYYWDWSSDLVTWLPPGHPKCQISQPASQLREELHLKAADQDDNMSSDESASDQEPMDVDEEVRKDRKQDTRERREVKKVPRKEIKDKKDRSLDPMDPAAYSDIPRGKWSDGLARHNEAKTGADTTASGPLYQMRPYPSPGAVLRSNKNSKPDPETSSKPKVSFPEKPE
ncbi:polyglutamine-binding protein 1 [Leptopilina boulardi]|uniref:polyglutamine-binding protein 1 n=1 Tax=Leptopilina boulardi TaxID=63433 RepID=UPI0021F58D7F|nr:polyglutamine-binding protein 1 [Leptopilina boulardi]